MLTSSLLICLLPILGAIGFGDGIGLLPPGGGEDGDGLVMVQNDDQPVEFDPTTLGQEIILTGRWAPSLDFADADVWYFDPLAAAKGDGTRENPFRDLATEINSDSTIVRCAANDYVVSNAAKGPVVGPGDVCVLMDGNHGAVRFLRYYFSDYVGFIAENRHGATFDRWDMERGQFYYLEGLKYSGNPRYARYDAGDLTDAGYNSFPEMIRASRDSNGNGQMDHVVIYDCLVDAELIRGESAYWSEAEWDSFAVGGIFIDRAQNIHIQDCQGYGTALGIGLQGTSSVYTSNINVFQNEFDRICGDGIRMSYTTETTISSSTWRDFYVINNDHVDGTQVVVACSDVIFSGNTMLGATEAGRYPSQYGFAVNFAGFQSSGTDAAHNFTLQNNVFYCPYSWDGIKFVGGTDVVIVANTVVGNGEPDDPTPTIRCTIDGNNIYMANNISAASQETPQAGVTAANNSDYIRAFDGAGFVNWSAGGNPLEWDLRLTAGSENVDAGTAINAPAVDILGVPRPQGAAHDIGAYEYQGGE